MAHKVRSVTIRVKKSGGKYRISSGKDVEVYDSEKACQGALNRIVTLWKKYGVQKIVVIIGSDAWAYKRNADGTYSASKIPVPKKAGKKKRKASKAKTRKAKKTTTKPKRKKRRKAKTKTKATTAKAPVKRKRRKAKRKSKSTAKTVAALPSPSSVPRKKRKGKRKTRKSKSTAKTTVAKKAAGKKRKSKAKSGGKKRALPPALKRWNAHVKAFRAAHPGMAYGTALKKAKPSFKG